MQKRRSERNRAERKTYNEKLDIDEELLETADEDAAAAAVEPAAVEPKAPEWIVEKVLGVRVVTRMVPQEVVAAAADDDDDNHNHEDAKMEEEATVAEAADTSDAAAASSTVVTASNAGETAIASEQPTIAATDAAADTADTQAEATLQENDDEPKIDAPQADEPMQPADDADAKSPKAAIEASKAENDGDENAAEVSEAAATSGDIKQEQDENRDAETEAPAPKPRPPTPEMVEAQVEEIYVKFKGLSYIHCEWKSLAELEALDKRIGGKVTRWKQRFGEAYDDGEYFNENFTVVDRVIAEHIETEASATATRTAEESAESLEGGGGGNGGDDGEIACGSGSSGGGEHHALVKWRSLQYDESTWEDVAIVPTLKLAEFRVRNGTPDPLKIVCRV